MQNDRGGMSAALGIISGAVAALVGIVILGWFWFSGARGIDIGVQPVEQAVEGGWTVSLNWQVRFGSRSVQNDFEGKGLSISCSLREVTQGTTVHTAATPTAPVATADRETGGTLAFPGVLPRRANYDIKCAIVDSDGDEVEEVTRRVHLGDAKPSPSPSPSPSPTTAAIDLGFGGTYTVAELTEENPPGCMPFDQGGQLAVVQDGATVSLRATSEDVWTGSVMDMTPGLDEYLVIVGSPHSEIFAAFYPDQNRLVAEVAEGGASGCVADFVATTG